MNHDFINIQDEDYEWVTESIQAVANSCCDGRVVSILEGGYRVQSAAASPFARSVTAHVRGLHRTDCITLWDPSEAAAEAEREWRAQEGPRRHRDEMYMRLAAEKIALRIARATRAESSGNGTNDNIGATTVHPPLAAVSNSRAEEMPSRKRRRSGKKVDYAALNKQMEEEAKKARIAKA